MSIPPFGHPHKKRKLTMKKEHMGKRGARVNQTTLLGQLGTTRDIEQRVAWNPSHSP